MIPIESLKELTKRLAFYQSSISEEERISLVLFALKEFLVKNNIQIEDEQLAVKSSNQYFNAINKATVDDLSWLKHGELDLVNPNIEIREPVRNLLNRLDSAYRSYFKELLNCGDTTHGDFAGLDKYMWLLKAIFFYLTGNQPYNFTKSKPTLKTIDKMLRESSSDLSSEELQSIKDVLDDIKEIESEVR